MNIIKKTDIFFCFNMDDNIILRKQLFNKKYVWFNTHGSALALKAISIFPMSTVFEQNLLFLNLENKLKKTTKVIVNNVKNIFDMLNNKFNDYSTFQKLLFILNLKLENKNLNFLNYLNDEINKTKFLFYLSNNIKKTLIFNSIIKPVMKDFFLDNVFTKNSIILSKRSQEIRKLYNNFD